MTTSDEAQFTGVRGRQAPQAWRVLALLTLANVLNFYDRSLPAILIEPVKEEFGFNDAQIGGLGASFIVVYALAGIWLGRLADHRSRRLIMGIGLLVWSVFTLLSAGVWSFTSLLLVRMGVGIGEASYAPAANSLIADLFPAGRRSRAVAIFQFGVPLGSILAFATTASIADFFDTWRAPFIVAGVPGVLLALLIFRIAEPRRGAAEDRPDEVASAAPAREPIRAIIAAVLRIATMRWLVVAAVGLQIGAYSIATFLVPLMQRYFELSMTTASLNAAVILGVAAIGGLAVGGLLCDRASRRSAGTRVRVGAVALTLSAPLAFIGLSTGPDGIVVFVTLLSLMTFLQFFFHTAALPALADVVEPRLRSSAVAVFFAASYLLGGAFGPVATGVLSETFAAPGHGVTAGAHGLHTALLVVMPLSLLLCALGLALASRTVDRDRRAMPDAGRPTAAV